MVQLDYVVICLLDMRLEMTDDFIHTNATTFREKL